MPEPGLWPPQHGCTHTARSKSRGLGLKGEVKYVCLCPSQSLSAPPALLFLNFPWSPPCSELKENKPEARRKRPPTVGCHLHAASTAGTSRDRKQAVLTESYWLPEAGGKGELGDTAEWVQDFCPWSNEKVLELNRGDGGTSL